MHSRHFRAAAGGAISALALLAALGPATADIVIDPDGTGASAVTIDRFLRLGIDGQSGALEINAAPPETSLTGIESIGVRGAREEAGSLLRVRGNGASLESIGQFSVQARGRLEVQDEAFVSLTSGRADPQGVGLFIGPGGVGSVEEREFGDASALIEGSGTLLDIEGAPVRVFGGADRQGTLTVSGGGKMDVRAESASRVAERVEPLLQAAIDELRQEVEMEGEDFDEVVDPADLVPDILIREAFREILTASRIELSSGVGTRFPEVGTSSLTVADLGSSVTHATGLLIGDGASVSVTGGGAIRQEDPTGAVDAFVAAFGDDYLRPASQPGRRRWGELRGHRGGRSWRGAVPDRRRGGQRRLDHARRPDRRRGELCAPPHRGAHDLRPEPRDGDGVEWRDPLGRARRRHRRGPAGPQRFQRRGGHRR